MLGEIPLTIEYTSKKIGRLLYDHGRQSLYTSPYVENNVALFLESNPEEPTFYIFRYVYDPSEPELSYVKTYKKGVSIKSLLGEEISLEILLPGRGKNELILVSDSGQVWQARIQKNNIKAIKKIGKLHSQIFESEEGFFLSFEIVDMVPYFTRQTKELAGLVVQEPKGFNILLNLEIFSEIDDEYILDFEGSQAIWNSSLDNLDLFYYNDETGLACISFPVNKRNQPVPISIVNLKEVKSSPKDVCCIGKAAYIIGDKKLVVYPDFKRYAQNTTISLPKSLIFPWFEPQYETCKFFDKENPQMFSIFSSLTRQVRVKKLDWTGIPKSKFKIFPETYVKTLGNKQAGFILANSRNYLWFKAEHIDHLHTHNLKIQILEKPIPDALESLRKLQSMGDDFSVLKGITESGIPSALLHERSMSLKRYYSKEEDQYIISHAYNDMNFKEIAVELKRYPTSLYLHTKNRFGTPICDKHSRFHKSCPDCNLLCEEWRKQQMEYIEQISYPEPKSHKEELDNFDSLKFIKRRKQKEIENRTKEYRSLLPGEIYRNIINFMVESDQLKGRSIKVIFEQCLHIFLSTYLNTIDIRKERIAKSILELFFEIQPSTQILYPLVKEYKGYSGKSFQPLHSAKLFFLKALLQLTNLYEEDACFTTVPLLLDFYHSILNVLGTVKDGFLAALLYLSKIPIPKHRSQTELAKTFCITEVTLRSRAAEIRENIQLEKFISQLKNHLILFRSIPESIRDERNMLYDIEDEIFRSIHNNNQFDPAIELLSTIEVKHLKENSPIISRIVFKLVTLRKFLDASKRLIRSSIRLLTRYNCCTEKIFVRLVKYLGSEDSQILNDLRGLIYQFKPELEGADRYEIVDALTPLQKLLIYEYQQNNKPMTEEGIAFREYLNNIVDKI